jgi:hypothetical protein
MSPKQPKPMTGAQLDTALITLFKPFYHDSQRARSLALAEIIGCQDRTVRKWISGEAEVPRHIAMLINLMLDTKTKPEELRP